MIRVYMILENQDSLLEILKVSDKDKITYFFDSTNSFNYKSLDKLLEVMITDILHKIGISPKYKGYFYLKDAIMLRYNSKDDINNIYLKLSKKYNVTPSCIERGMCRAIEIGFIRNDIDYVSQLFGNSICSSRGCPTNLETITTIVERLKNVI